MAICWWNRNKNNIVFPLIFPVNWSQCLHCKLLQREMCVPVCQHTEPTCVISHRSIFTSLLWCCNVAAYCWTQAEVWSLWLSALCALRFGSVDPRARGCVVIQSADPGGQATWVRTAGDIGEVYSFRLFANPSSRVKQDFHLNVNTAHKQRTCPSANKSNR